MIERIKEFLFAEWARYFPDKPRPADIRALISRGSYGKHCKTSLLLFADAQTKPFAIVKVPLFEDGYSFVRQEYEVLSRLRHAIPQEAVLNVPCCWLIEGIEKLPLLLETALIGNPLRKVAKWSNSSHPLEMGINWISQLHRSTFVDHCFTEEDYEQFVTDPINAALDWNFSLRIEVGSLDEIASRLKILIGKRVPLVCSHNDFRVSNLRIHDATLLVADWEFAAWPGLPMLDVLNLAVDYFAETQATGFAQAFSDVLCDGNRYAMGVQSHLQVYCAQMGMDETLIPMWPDFLLIHKLHLAQHILLPLQVFDGLEWVEELGKAIRLRRGHADLC